MDYWLQMADLFRYFYVSPNHLSMIFRGSLLSILIFIVLYSPAQDLPEELKTNIQLRMDNGTTAGIVIGIVSSKGTEYHSFGVASYENNTPLNEHSVFEIGSISKTFTGILLADMVIKGELNLDDPLQDLLPEGVQAPTRNGESIRLFQLSNHTSGLPRLPSNLDITNPQNPYADYTDELMYEFLDDLELTRDIGAKYEYSNYAVGLLGNVLAASQDMTYEELMVKVIAKPLGMMNTATTLSSKMREQLAAGHYRGLQVENWDIPSLEGAGAILSTTSDMIKYIAANMGIEKSKLYPAMQMAHENTREGNDLPIVGLGWHTIERKDLSIIWHSGRTGGYSTFAGFIKDGDKGVVVLSNSSEAGIDDIGNYLLDPTSNLIDPKPAISTKVKSIISEEGVDAAVEAYWELKKKKSKKYDFSEVYLNTLGYSYLRDGEVETAAAVFKINVEAFPKSSNVYDSYGEALINNGENEKAITNYKKSFELNPGNANAIKMLKKLGVDTESLTRDVVVSDDILESYVGKYELAPGFVVTISKEGSQMIAQATGQSASPIFPKSENVFYFKMVDAQLQFNSKDGEIKSVTLFQFGNEIVGKKLEE